MDNYSEKVKFNGGVKYLNDDGQLHRTDGPAVEWYYGYKEWWLYGNKVSEGDHINYMGSIFYY